MTKKFSLQKGVPSSSKEFLNEGKKINVSIREKGELSKGYEHDMNVLYAMRDMIASDSALNIEEKTKHLSIINDKISRVEKEYTENVDKKVDELTKEADILFEKMKQKEELLKGYEEKIAQTKFQATNENMNDVAKSMSDKRIEFEQNREKLSNEIGLSVEMVNTVKRYNQYHKKPRKIDE